MYETLELVVLMKNSFFFKTSWVPFYKSILLYVRPVIILGLSNS